MSRRTTVLAAIAVVIGVFVVALRLGPSGSSLRASGEVADAGQPVEEEARGVEISGVVVDEGVPVANARVTIEGDGLAGRMETTTDAAGGFRFEALPEGSYRVWAHETDLVARAVRAPRFGDGPFSPVTLTLEPATIVVGRVVDRATGIGVAAAVSVEPAVVGDDAPRFARTSEDGVFRIEGVPRGRWLVDAWAPGWVSTGAIELEAGRVIPTIELAAGAIVEGRVVDGEGRPIAGASVIAVGEGRLEASADVDADRLRRFSGFAPAGGAIEEPAATAEPRFVPRGELGVLVGPLPPIPRKGTAPARQAPIVAMKGTLGGPPPPLAVDPAYAPVRTTGADGRFRLTGLEGASWRVVATAPGGERAESEPLVLEVGDVVTGVEIVAP